MRSRASSTSSPRATPQTPCSSRVARWKSDEFLLERHPHFTDAAAKHGFDLVDEAADRHGVLEWQYARPRGDNYILYVTVAAWVAPGPAVLTCESFAGLTTRVGFIREAVTRFDATPAEFESWDVANQLVESAANRAVLLLGRCEEAAANEEPAILTPFVSRRSSFYRQNYESDHRPRLPAGRRKPPRWPTRTAGSRWAGSQSALVVTLNRGQRIAAVTASASESATSRSTSSTAVSSR